MKKLVVVVLVLALVVSALAGCAAPAAQSSAPAPEESKAQESQAQTGEAETPAAEEADGFDEILPVKIGVGPYSMYQQFELAKERGIDKQFGLDLTVETYNSTTMGFESLLRGDVDISTGAPADHIAVLESTDEIVNYEPVGIFRGFFYVGNSENTRAWDDLVAEMGEDAAKEFQITNMKGKTFCIIPQRKPWIISTISQFGMTEDDVEFMYFADDQKAATAFMSGQGDFYMGSLPQQTAVINADPEKYVNAGGQEIMGDAGLWYDTTLTTRKFFEEKPEEAVRFYALMCAMVNLFDKDPEAFAADAIEIFKQVGTTYTVDEYVEFQTVFDDFMSLEEAGDTFYNADSDMYWKPAVDFQIQVAKDDGTLTKDIDSADYYQQGEDLYKTLLGRQDLIDLINSFK